MLTNIERLPSCIEALLDLEAERSAEFARERPDDGDAVRGGGGILPSLSNPSL